MGWVQHGMFHMCFDVAHEYTNASIKQQVTGPTSCSHLSIGVPNDRSFGTKSMRFWTHFLKLTLDSHNLTSCDLWGLGSFGLLPKYLHTDDKWSHEDHGVER